MRGPPAKPTLLIVGMGDTGILTAAHVSRRFRIVALGTKPALVSGQELGMRVTQPEIWQREYLVDLKRFQGLSDVECVHGKAQNVDLERQTVSAQLATGQHIDIAWDYLVIATGIRNGFWRDDDVCDMNTVEAKLNRQRRTLTDAKHICIVGGGPSGTNLALNLARNYRDKRIDFVFSGPMPLPRYHPKTQTYHMRLLNKEPNLTVHPNRRAILPEPEQRASLWGRRVVFEGAHPPIDADAVVWTTGTLSPHTEFLPRSFCTEAGYVRTDEFLRVEGQQRIFAIGDVADTDPLRCSARNWAYKLLAQNLEATLDADLHGLKPFKPPAYRWGSTVGLQSYGLDIHQANGGRYRLWRWVVKRLLFPLAVRRFIYRGIEGEKSSELVR